MDAKAKGPFEDIMDEIRVNLPSPFDGTIGDAGEARSRGVGRFLEMSADLINGDVSERAEFVMGNVSKGGVWTIGGGGKKAFLKRSSFCLSVVALSPVIGEVMGGIA